MKCTQCNSHLEKGAKFCSQCGAKVHNDEKINVQSHQGSNQKLKNINSKENKSKNRLIALVIGAIALVAIILAVLNLSEKSDNQDVVTNDGDHNTNKEELEDYSMEGLAEHFGIDEELLSWEQMSDAVNKIKQELDSSMEPDEQSSYIRDVIEEEYGHYNARAFEEGLLIDGNMEEHDKRQVMIALKGFEPVKRIVNPIDFEFQNSEKNEYRKLKDVYNGWGEKIVAVDTEGFYEIKDFNIGYPTVNIGKRYNDETEDFEDKVTAFIELQLILKEDLETDELEDYIAELEEINVSGEKLKDILLKDVSLGGTSIEEYVFYLEEERVSFIPKDSLIPIRIEVDLAKIVEGTYTEEGLGIDLYGNPGGFQEKLYEGEIESPVLNIEGIEMVFEDKDGDFYIDPKVIGSK